jgi:hypothetical protein
MEGVELTAETHREIPLNIDLEINNEKQDCKIGTVCVGTCGGGKMNEGY